MSRFRELTSHFYFTFNADCPIRVPRASKQIGSPIAATIAWNHFHVYLMSLPTIVGPDTGIGSTDNADILPKERGRRYCCDKALRVNRDRIRVGGTPGGRHGRRASVAVSRCCRHRRRLPNGNFRCCNAHRQIRDREPRRRRVV